MIACDDQILSKLMQSKGFYTKIISIEIDGKTEKFILRKAFEGFLPKDILWRQKEQFSDGVGYGWIDSLKEFAEMQITDEMLKKSSHVFKINPPDTKEAYYYRMIFSELFHI